MSSTPTHRAVNGTAAAALLLAVLLAGCATATAMRTGRQAEQALDYDRAIAEYTKVVRADPGNVDARTSLGARQAAGLAGAHLRGPPSRRPRSLRGGGGRIPDRRRAEPDRRARRRRAARDPPAAAHEGQRDPRWADGSREPDRSHARSARRQAWTCPTAPSCPVRWSSATARTSRAVFMSIAKFANINLVFDPAFRDQPISIDLRNVTLEDALDALTASTHTFYRVTAPRTITVVPDTPAKRREYQEADRPHVLSEQRRHQGNDRPAAGGDRHPADLADHGHQRDLDQGHAGTHRRGRAN